MSYLFVSYFFFSSRRRHTRCALVTGVQTCALPICADAFDVAMIERGDDWSVLCTREQDLIVELGCLSPAGYNLTLGGEGNPGRVVTQIGSASCRESVCQYV